MSVLLDPKLGVTTPYTLQSEVEPEVRDIMYDNIKFYTVRFPALTATKAKILIVHGWCEHTTMYYRLMEYLSSIGYESFIFDQRGAGRTSLGKYRGRCGRTESLVYKDVDEMIRVFTEGKGTQKYPLYLLGHLAGGGIVLNYVMQGKYKDSISGVITTGPMIRIADRMAPPPYVEYILSLIGSWFPYLPWGSINRDPNVRSVITTADEWVDYLQQELLTQGNCTLGQIKFMFERGHKLANMDAKNMHINQNLRLLVIHCVNDPMTSFKHLKQFFDKLPLKNKRFVELDGVSHSVFIDKEEIFEESCKEIVQFLNN